MRHLGAYKLVSTYKMPLMYLLVNIHINNQPIVYKVTDVVTKSQDGEFFWSWLLVTTTPFTLYNVDWLLM
jgi:hypothetical protein